jgi:hypothetical protein
MKKSSRSNSCENEDLKVFSSASQDNIANKPKVIYVYYIIDKFNKIFVTFYGIYIIWIVFHYFASHLYVRYCVPWSFYGFIMSPIISSTPHCQGLRWVLYNGGNQINNMWLNIGSWIGIKLIL